MSKVGALALPRAYRDLLDPAMPATIRNAVALYGTTEYPASRDNPDIISWAREAGISNVYRKDETPWCGLFALIVAHRSNWAHLCPKTPLWALSWLEFGNPIDKPGLGDILVWSRKGGGHVGFYVGEDDTHYFVLGGNQSNTVNIIRLTKTRDNTGRVFRGARTPVWRFSKPEKSVPVRRSSAGTPVGESLQ